MTVSELQEQINKTIERFPAGAMVESGLGDACLDIIADWRVMRAALEGIVQDIGAHDLSEPGGAAALWDETRARAALDGLKLKP